MRLLYFVILIFITPLSCKNQRSDTALKIAVAANTQYAMNIVAHEFSKEHNIQCDLIVGSSGKLTAQIIEGAPYDIFISADMKYPQLLTDRKVTHGSIAIYAKGKLVCWSLQNRANTQLHSLSPKKVDHFAIANPDLAPYGVAAKEALSYYQLLPEIKDKLVFGESISQTNQFIITEAATAGLTAKSVVLSPQMKDRGYWTEVDSNAYQAIQQGMVIIRHKKSNLSLAKQFFDFVLSPKGKSILREYGYEVN